MIDMPSILNGMLRVLIVADAVIFGVLVYLQNREIRDYKELAETHRRLIKLLRQLAHTRRVHIQVLEELNAAKTRWNAEPQDL